MFHRVVPKFIIQGGNSDSPKSMKKRREIGRYLLPRIPNSNSHHCGVISMPSSEIDNPHKLASPMNYCSTTWSLSFGRKLHCFWKGNQRNGCSRSNKPGKD